MSHMDLYWRVPSNQSTAYGNGASFSCRVTGVLGYYQSPSLPDPWSLMGSTIMNVHDFQSPFSTMSIHFPCCFFWERPSPCWKWIIISLSKSQAASLWNQGRNPVVPMDPMDPMESMPCGARWWTPNPTSAVVLLCLELLWLLPKRSAARWSMGIEPTTAVGMGWVSSEVGGFDTQQTGWVECTLTSPPKGRFGI